MSPPLYKLRVPDSLAALVRGMHPHLKRKVKAALKGILLEPHSGKALKGELLGLRSFRVGRFRIIYRVSDRKEIQLVAIGSRKSIYEQTYQTLKKES